MMKKNPDKNKSDSKDPAKFRAVSPVLKGQEMELEITGLGSAGEGVGRFRDIAVFVPGALPGEKVTATAAIMPALCTKPAEAVSCSIFLMRRN